MNTTNYICGICNYGCSTRHLLATHYQTCRAKYTAMMNRRRQAQTQSQQAQRRVPRQSRSYNPNNMVQLPRRRQQTQMDRLREKQIREQYAEQRRLQSMRKDRFNNAQRKRTVDSQRSNTSMLSQQRALERQRMERRERYARNMNEMSRRERQQSFQNIVKIENPKARIEEARKRQKLIPQTVRQTPANYNANPVNQRSYQREQMRKRRERAEKQRALETKKVEVKKAPKEAPSKELIPYNRFSATNMSGLFYELVKGKNVVIVGPSKSLTGKGMGEFIDSFDLVVRTNKSFKIPKSSRKDIGSRIDILYNNLNRTDSPGENELNIVNLYKKGIKFVCSPYPPVEPFLSDIIHFSGKNRGVLPFHHIDSKTYSRMLTYLRSRPLTGTCAIMDLLEFEPARLHITGIDFYRYGYGNGYQKKKLNDRELRNKRSNNIHKSEPQIRMLRYSLIDDQRVSMDSVLEDILYKRYKNVVNVLLKRFSDNSVDNVFKNSLEEMKSLMEGVSKVRIVGNTQNYVSENVPDDVDLEISMNLELGSGEPKVLFYNAKIERYLKSNSLPESVERIITFKKLPKSLESKAVYVAPEFRKVCHQVLRKLKIEQISTELFCVLLFAVMKDIKIQTVGIDLGNNKNRQCNPVEENTVFRYLKRVQKIVEVL